MMRVRIALLVWLMGAQALAQPTVPESLEPWRDWVLYGEEYRGCPVQNGEQPGDPGAHRCVWPGELRLNVTRERAEFAQDWQLFADAWVPLPGDVEHWPAGVLVDGGPAAVVAREGRPSVHLPRGTHRLSGELRWASRPASLAVPTEIALLRLTVDGSAVARPELDGARLWLGPRPTAAAESERVDVVVYRRLADGQPVTLETRARLQVSGPRREITLAGALLPGWLAQELRSDLPARLDERGTLRVALRPGSWELTLIARAPAEAVALDLPNAVGPWPNEELWSFAANPRLRVTALEGGVPMDASQAGVPFEWQELPSFRVAAGQTLELTERSRGELQERNRLQLQRELWLDFSGRAFTALDTVSGQLRSGWRLDMATPYRMTSAASSGDSLLITDGDAPDLAGVELRAAELQLRATARLDRAGATPVTGYREVFDAVQTTLHLPPNYRLLVAPGADQSVDAWLNRFRLLDLFLILIVAGGAWRLFGPAAGILALAGLALAFHEPGAPRWAWLNLLVAFGLLRVAPEGRLRRFSRWYRDVSAIALLLLLVPFIGNQLRLVLFPQLEMLGSAGPYAKTQPGSPSAEAMLEGIVVTARQDDARMGSGAAEGEATIPGQSYTRYPPGALVQTGPGIPDWRWSQHFLAWDGPVEPQQAFRMLILGPWLVGAWRLATVGLLLGLAWAMARRSWTLPAGLLRPATRSAAAGIALMIALTGSPDAGAQETSYPSPALLEELKRRLTEPAPCHPNCAELAQANVQITGSSVTIALELGIQDQLAVPVPAALAGWRPDSIDVDGQERRLLYRSGDGRSWLSLGPGAHQVVLRGPLPGGDTFVLPFPLPPRRIEVGAAGWDIGGVVEGRLPSGTLELTRRQSSAGEPPAALGEFPPFVRVTREVVLDLDWLVDTRIDRIAPAQGAFALEIDLLAQESLLTADVPVRDGRALIAFAPGQQQVLLRSRLPSTGSLSLTASAEATWTEVWRLRAAPIWRVRAEGLPSTPPEIIEPSFYVPEYYPRPGETLTATVTRPTPSAGESLAIDAVQLSTSVGERAGQSTLAFDYRSSRGGQHDLRLPPDSELQGLSIDGRPIPLALQDGTLPLPIQPGQHHVELAWRSSAGLGLRSAMAGVDLAAPASNLSLTLTLPADRWVLLSFGPTWGPAVLYWSELAVFALAALIVGRLRASPLRPVEWLLLGLGLSTFAWPVLLLFAAWVFALRWREQTIWRGSRVAFNALQVALGLLSVAALLAVLGAIPVGLLGRPDMHIASPMQTGELSWFADQTAGPTPSAGVISISLWYYKAAMLAWALWLSFALLRWMPSAWRAFAHEGIWRGKLQP